MVYFKPSRTRVIPKTVLNPILSEYQARSQSMLDSALADTDVPNRLRCAMRYSTLAGGKRFRAMLVYAAGAGLKAPTERLDVVATAIECIHSYSLIHDDLPAMDDDNLRRGQATCHIKFDEATAILAGDALQTLAFELLNSENSPLSPQQSRLISHKLAVSAGQAGMVGGQMLDILATEQSLSRDQLKNIHNRKTGALIKAAVICGALCSDTVSDEQLAQLHIYAENIGLAFQVIDDVLDIESSTEVLGKQSGADQANRKSTYPAIMGVEASRDLTKKLYQQAIASLAAISDNKQQLIDLATLVVNRKH